MNDKERVELLIRIAEQRGDCIADPTLRIRYEVTISMLHGFRKTKVGPPPPESVIVEITSIWGNEVRIRGKSINISFYQEDVGEIERPYQQRGGKICKMKIEAVRSIVDRLIFEGNWGVRYAV
jgi:hypothetical protein